MPGKKKKPSPAAAALRYNAFRMANLGKSESALRQMYQSTPHYISTYGAIPATKPKRVPKSAHGRSLASKKASKTNPWLIYLKKHRKPGVSLKALAADYHKGRK